MKIETTMLIFVIVILSLAIAASIAIEKNYQQNEWHPEFQTWHIGTHAFHIDPECLNGTGPLLRDQEYCK